MTPPMLLLLRLMMILEIHVNIQHIGFFKTTRKIKNNIINGKRALKTYVLLPLNEWIMPYMKPT
jgi:hypothetical protein